MTSSPLFITGVAGFIGFHTARRLLDSGHNVMGVDNMNDYYDVNLKQSRLDILQTYNGFQFTQCDITDKDTLEKIWSDHGGFTQVIHLAAQAGVRYSLKNPYEYIRTNCMGHVTILELCRHTKGFEHLVYASSSSVYGGNTKLPFATDDPVETPVSLYAATKRSDELFSHTYSHLYGVPSTGLRFFTVYGPWGRPDMAYFIFTKAIIEGTPIPLFNAGNMRRDFTYIDDIVDGILDVMNAPFTDKTPHRVFNLGNHKSEALLDFVEEIEKAVGKKAFIENKPMQAGDVKETYADIAASESVFDYKPKTSITEGIPKFVEWYKGYYGL